MQRQPAFWSAAYRRGQRRLSSPFDMLWSIPIGQIGIGRRAFHAVAFAQPLQQVAVFAAFATKRLMFDGFGFAT
jgi:hypothetical protein